MESVKIERGRVRQVEPRRGTLFSVSLGKVGWLYGTVLRSHPVKGQLCMIDRGHVASWVLKRDTAQIGGGLKPFWVDDTAFSEGYFRILAEQQVEFGSADDVAVTWQFRRAWSSPRELNLSAMTWEIGNLLGLAAHLGYGSNVEPAARTSKATPIVGRCYVIRMASGEARTGVVLRTDVHHPMYSAPLLAVSFAHMRSDKPGRIDAAHLQSPILMSRQPWLHGYFDEVLDMSVGDLRERTDNTLFFSALELAGDAFIFETRDITGKRVWKAGRANPFDVADFDLDAYTSGRLEMQVKITDLFVPR